MKQNSEELEAQLDDVLFVNNLLADFPDDDTLREEVEITLLHEIGHYFGLDEDDMVRLGLD
jgi:predicted Zn-dependent protease with MMP-like domain